MRRDYVYGYPTKDESSVRCFVAVSCGSGCDHPHPKVTFHSDLMYCVDCHKWFLPCTPVKSSFPLETMLSLTRANIPSSGIRENHQANQGDEMIGNKNIQRG